MINDHWLPNVSTKTRWTNIVPIKINVHAWKVKLDCLPTRSNISRQGIEINSILCPSCGVAVESTSHIFFTCHIARDVFHKIANCWDVNFMELSSYEEWLEWLLNLLLPSKHKSLIKGVFYTMWWTIWNFHNKSIFSSTLQSKASLFEDINIKYTLPHRLESKDLISDCKVEREKYEAEDYHTNNNNDEDDDESDDDDDVEEYDLDIDTTNVAMIRDHACDLKVDLKMFDEISKRKVMVILLQ
ncbi:RNA-directed DNA polymerase, eukaryota, partial [Tanacetum coccineum]